MTESSGSNFPLNYLTTEPYLLLKLVSCTPSFPAKPLIFHCQGNNPLEIFNQILLHFLHSTFSTHNGTA